MTISQPFSITIIFFALLPTAARAEQPPRTDYCVRLQQEVQGKKHGFLAGNVTYYVGGFHASWDLVEHETLGLTHPFHHDLRSRGVGLLKSTGSGEQDTGIGNDFSGWEFYKDTRVLFGSVIIDGEVHRYPVPTKMYWRPDRMICEYDVAGVKLREEKFIAANDAACSIITSSKPVTLRFDGRSFFGRHSVSSSATIEYDSKHNAIRIVEGGQTKSKPETDRSEHIGPIMYEGMSTVLTASRSFADSHRFSKGKQGECQYEFEVQCDTEGTAVIWSMDDEARQAIGKAMELLDRSDTDRSKSDQRVRSPKGSTEAHNIDTVRKHLVAKTREVNRQLNEQVPYFRCSEKKFEDIYYYLWSLYVMYYIDVQHAMEMEPHTQTAVNNFLGMHRYDATFQIKVGSWMNDKSKYAYGNVLTWKRLFEKGYYRKSPDGVVALADNKGTTWHSGAYGNELSEHVLGAWQVYQHSGDVDFIRACYEGYFREVFFDRIAPFFSNHFEVAEVLKRMARLTGHPEDVNHWEQPVSQSPEQIRNWFDQRWEANGHRNFFGGAKNGMLMTTGFWHMRSKHFPRKFAQKMVRAWALDQDNGFFPDGRRPFPLAMSKKSMRQFATQDDNAFGYTPDTAYFTLDGMFRQRLANPAWQLTLNHLSNYNFHPEWHIPIAPEAYRRDGHLFGDQYSNFNAGKLLLILEGLAGVEYSIPDRNLFVRDAMPPTWRWMEVRLPVQIPGRKTAWPTIRYERTASETEVRKSISVADSPLRVTIEPWSEGRSVMTSTTGEASVELRLAPEVPNERISK